MYLLAILFVLCALTCQILARQKGKPIWLWTILGLLFGPIAIVAIALASGAGKQPQHKR